MVLSKGLYAFSLVFESGNNFGSIWTPDSFGFSNYSYDYGYSVNTAQYDVDYWRGCHHWEGGSIYSLFRLHQQPGNMSSEHAKDTCT